MGYFDALASGSFKTMPDGRRLFYPLGVIGHGYVIPAEPQFERLRRQVKTFTMVSLVVIIALSVAQLHVWSFAVAALLTLGYAIWARSQVRELQPTDERLSYQESLATQARLHNRGVLWLMEGVSITYVAIGFVILAVQPDTWPMALGAIVFFGACAVVFARMLILRERAAA